MVILLVETHFSFDLPKTCVQLLSRYIDLAESLYLYVSFTLDNDIISKLENAVHLGHHVNISNINEANRELICPTVAQILYGPICYHGSTSVLVT